MVSSQQHAPADPLGPPLSATMPPSYHFRLRAMRQNRTRVGSPGEMDLEYYLPIDDQRHEIDFVIRDEVATFEPLRKDDKNTELKARFCEIWTRSRYLRYFLTNVRIGCMGTQLMLEPHTPLVYVESPPTNDLPRQFDNRIAIEMSDSHKQRVIYLRPDDTVFLEAEQHHIKVLAVDTSTLGVTGAHEGEQSTPANEIQVESSVQLPTVEAGTTSGAPEDDDDDDLDAFATPAGDEDDPSHPTVLVVETPSGLSRDRKPVLPTASDANNAQYAIESTNDPGAQRNQRESKPPQDDAESQNVLPSTDQKPLKKYGRTGTPKRKREIPESSDPGGMTPGSSGEENAAIKLRRGETRSSPPKRKHSMSMTTDDDEDDDGIPASTAPPLKRTRGRPTKASKAARAPTKTPAPVKTGKPRDRPSNASKAVLQAEDDAAHLHSPGKLVAAKPRRKIESPDLNPRSSGAPESPSTPMTGKPPKKILLSNSKFAQGKVASAFLKRHGATIVDDIPNKRTDFICVVGNGELVTTAKVLRSLALGKKVVADQWLEQSMTEGVLLELDGYIHEDLPETTPSDRGELFKDKTLFITDAQVKAYGDGIKSIKELGLAAGARKVESGSAKKASSTPAASTIILGGDGNDQDAWKLTDEDRVVYQKGLLTQSVIKGELLVDEVEFKWQKAGKKGKR